jgi:hypothetical protein
MNNGDDPSRQQLRWAAYWVLIALAAGNMAGRILAVTAADRYVPPSRIEKEVRADLVKFRAAQEAKGFSGATLADQLQRKEVEIRKKKNRARPFISGNDRSRWLTVRALVEDGTYAIDHIVTDPNERAIWDTIDMVKHPDRNGEPHLYSSKPTLLPTLLAGQYWLVQKVTGWSLSENPHEVVRTMLLPINMGGMVVMFLLIAKIAERFGATDWGRLLVVGAATFGTLLFAFAIVLNNHLIAAVSAAVALYASVRIWYDDERRSWYFMLAGFFAAFTAANELPALAFFGLLGLALLWKAPKQTLLFGLPAALVVVAAALGTNYAAHDTVLPPYAHRAEGMDWQTGNWYDYTYNVGDREIPSYWKSDADSIQSRSPVDRGEPSRGRYALHCLVGHHGLLSLTPIWLLSIIGAAVMICGKGPQRLPALGALIAIPTLVCLAFYLLQGEENRNYGGTSSGLRWMLWFAPLWLVAMIPAADWSAGGRLRRVTAGVLLALSAMSASFPTWNPWSHPWIARFMQYMGWIEL